MIAPNASLCMCYLLNTLNTLCTRSVDKATPGGGGVPEDVTEWTNTQVDKRGP